MTVMYNTLWIMINELYIQAYIILVKWYNSYNICTLCNVQKQITTMNLAEGNINVKQCKLFEEVGGEIRFQMLPLITHNIMFGGTVRKIICTTNHKEKKIQNK